MIELELHFLRHNRRCVLHQLGPWQRFVALAPYQQPGWLACSTRQRSREVAYRRVAKYKPRVPVRQFRKQAVVQPLCSVDAVHVLQVGCIRAQPATAQPTAHHEPAFAAETSRWNEQAVEDRSAACSKCVTKHLAHDTHIHTHTFFQGLTNDLSNAASRLGNGMRPMG